MTLLSWLCLSGTASAQDVPQNFNMMDWMMNRPGVDLAPEGAKNGYTPMLSPMVSQPNLKKLCGVKGSCLLFVNNTKDWDITGIFYDVSDPSKGKPRWVNQFAPGGKLGPMRATAWPQIGDRRMTAIPFRVTWRNRKTGQVVASESTGTLSLFDEDPVGKKTITTVVLKVVAPTVTVEPDAASGGNRR